MADIKTLEERIRENARKELKRDLNLAFEEARLYTASSSFGRGTALFMQKEDGQFYPVANPQHAINLLQTVCFESLAPQYEKEALDRFMAQANNERTLAKQDTEALDAILKFVRQQSEEMDKNERCPTAIDWNALYTEIKNATGHREEW
jgi:hypothetical protein